MLSSFDLVSLISNLNAIGVRIPPIIHHGLLASRQNIHPGCVERAVTLFHVDWAIIHKKQSTTLATAVFMDNGARFLDVSCSMKVAQRGKGGGATVYQK